MNNLLEMTYDEAQELILQLAEQDRDASIPEDAGPNAADRIDQLRSMVDYLLDEVKRFKVYADAHPIAPCVNCGRPADPNEPGNPRCRECLELEAEALKDSGLRPAQTKLDRG